MNREVWKWILAFFFVVFLTAGALTIWSGRTTQDPVVIAGTAVPPPPELDESSIDEGAVLYAQNCATCHGANLEGAPDWKIPLENGSLKPPPHDDSGHTWHHPDFQLLEIIARGGAAYGGSMPAFEATLESAEREAILTFLKSEWGREAREYQWWITNTYPTPTPVSPDGR